MGLNKKKILIIFVDALPYSHLEKMTFLRGISQRSVVQSGIGYTVNLATELFSGKTPDDVDFFNKWTYSNEGPFRHLQEKEKEIKIIEKIPLLRYLYRRELNKIKKTSNIKLSLLPWLEKKSIDIKKDRFPHTSIFNIDEGFTILEPINYKGNDQDESIFLRALDEIKKGTDRIFCYFLGFDTIAHTFGIDSIEAIRKIKMLDSWIKKIHSAFLKKHNECEFIIISDHGMENISEEINPEEIIKKIKKKVEGRLIYFIDSVMIRFWTESIKDTKIIEKVLALEDRGMLVNNELRKKYQATLKDAGDVLFELKPGSIFFPDFFVGQYRNKREIAKAMHGYLPETKPLEGILLYTGSKSVVMPHRIKTKDVFSWICNVCELNYYD